MSLGCGQRKRSSRRAPSWGRPRDAEQGRAPCPVVGRCSQFNFADVFQAAVKQNLLRCRVARVGIRPDRLETEGPEPVIDDRSGRFTGISLAPIRLTEPISERGLFAAIASAAVEADASDQAVGFLQRAGKAARSPRTLV